MQESINQIAIQLQITSAEKQEHDNAIKKLKAIIDDKDKQIDHLQKEIAIIAQRLCTAESKLFDLE